MDVQDFFIDENGDMGILNGDLTIDFSDNLQIQNIVESFPGFWKEFPLCGVGIQSFLCSTGQQQALKNSISSQLQADGFNVKSVTVGENFEIKIDANRV